MQGSLQLLRSGTCRCVASLSPFVLCKVNELLRRFDHHVTVRDRIYQPAGRTSQEQPFNESSYPATVQIGAIGALERSITESPHRHAAAATAESSGQALSRS